MTTAPHPARQDNIPLGVATIVGTVLALSLGDALIKALGGGVGISLWQIFIVRSLIAVPVLLGFAWVLFGAQRLAPLAFGWIAVRSLLLVVMWIAYYVSLPLLPLAVAAAANYTLPLFIVAFAALAGGEVVGRLQWIGVAIGFLGIVLVLRPGGDAFQWAALLPILAAILYAAAMVLTRLKCREEHPATLALGLNAAFVLCGSLAVLSGWMFDLQGSGFLTTTWSPLTGIAWLNLTILAGLILIASVGTAIAYQAAPASTVGTFDFAYVGFALIWGAVFFGERPDALALAGILLIVCAGVLAVRRPYTGA